MLISIGLSLLGLLFIYLEFFMPGGLIAILGGFLVVAGVTYFSSLEIAIGYKVLYFVASAICTAGSCKLALWVIRSRKKDQFFLETNQEGYVAATFDQSLLGQDGEVLSDLKPSGHILVGESRHQASSEGEYVAKGKKITILGGKGAYLIVKERKNE